MGHLLRITKSPCLLRSVFGSLAFSVGRIFLGLGPNDQHRVPLPSPAPIMEVAPASRYCLAPATLDGADTLRHVDAS